MRNRRNEARLQEADELESATRYKMFSHWPQILVGHIEYCSGSGCGFSASAESVRATDEDETETKTKREQ